MSRSKIHGLNPTPGRLCCNHNRLSFGTHGFFTGIGTLYNHLAHHDQLLTLPPEVQVALPFQQLQHFTKGHIPLDGCI